MSKQTLIVALLITAAGTGLGLGVEALADAGQSQVTSTQATTVTP